jgi:septal ring factor EnvC (AmiA/AmiB activator)
MKSTSPAASSSSSTHTSSFAPRASSSSTTGAPLRSGSVTDYRANIERQAREQKSIGGIINYVVYALAAFLILCATLAGYGAYVLSKQIQHQSVTLSDLDTRYTQANRDLNAQIKTVDDTLTDSLNQTRAQISRQQQVILQQQEALNSLMAENTKLTAAANAAESALRQERQTRAYETASLRGRVRALELLNHPEQ